MAEKDMVMSHLRIIRTWAATPAPPGGQRIYNSDCIRVAEWIDDALDLLKPISPIHKPEWREDYYVCGNCGGWVVKPRQGIQDGDNYCSRCGREIKWNE